MVSTLTGPMSSAAAAAAIAPNSVAAVAPAPVTAPASPFLSSRPLVSVYTGQSSMVGASSDQPPPPSPVAPPLVPGDPSYAGPGWDRRPTGPTGPLPRRQQAPTGRRLSLPDRCPTARTGRLLRRRATTGRRLHLVPRITRRMAPRPTRPLRLHLLPPSQRRPTRLQTRNPMRLHLAPRTPGRTGPRHRHCPTAATTLRPWLHLVVHPT